jgi:hypothetical protein
MNQHSNFSKKKNDYNWTWEGKDYASWVKTNSSSYETPAVMTHEEMISDICDRLDESGFFNDCLNWLSRMAPRKISGFLRSLCVGNNRVTYLVLCKAVYNMGFKASDMVERRMIIGETNDWVRMYFEDFPLGK